MQQKILDQLSAKVAEGWNKRDTTYVYLFGGRCPVSLASDEDKRLFERNGRWIYKGVYAVVFEGQLYRVNI